MRPIRVKRERRGRDGDHAACLPPDARTRAGGSDRGAGWPQRWIGDGAAGLAGRGQEKATTRPATGGVTAAAIWGGATTMLHALVWQQGMPCGSSGWQGDGPP
ncbi:hypothetical protein [Acidibrevibacterium fodinaquatile]|jgi:hypothetical protein|uniref:hypothetical protein n=1 Tax=Acidibrevibacterium fodinaquatile TaxID=1969806 RepID=UPI0013B40E54|nr:hypothetical protein [Acidibrevibacterium fodinaquatile]